MLVLACRDHAQADAHRVAPPRRAFSCSRTARHRRRVAAARAGGGAAFHRAVELRVFDFGFRVVLVHPAAALLDDDLEVHALGPGAGHELQGHGAVGLLGQPERADERDFRAAAGAFALDGARPEVGDGRRAVGVFGVELGQFLLGLLLDPLAPFADFIGEALAVLGDVFEDDLVEQDGHGVEVAGKGVRAHAQGFERDGAAAGKRVHDQRAGAGRAAQRLVRGLGERAAGVQVFLDGGVVPVGEVGDEIEEGLRSSTLSSNLFGFCRAASKRWRLSALSRAWRSWVVHSSISFRAFSRKAPGRADPPDQARAPRRSPPGTPPAVAVPTRCAASRYARAGSISPAAHGPRSA